MCNGYLELRPVQNKPVVHTHLLHPLSFFKLDLQLSGDMSQQILSI